MDLCAVLFQTFYQRTKACTALLSMKSFFDRKIILKTTSRWNHIFPHHSVTAGRPGRGGLKPSWCRCGPEPPALLCSTLFVCQEESHSLSLSVVLSSGHRLSANPRPHSPFFRFSFISSGDIPPAGSLQAGGLELGGGVQCV